MVNPQDYTNLSTGPLPSGHYPLYYIPPIRMLQPICHTVEAALEWDKNWRLLEERLKAGIRRVDLPPPTLFHRSESVLSHSYIAERFAILPYVEGTGSIPAWKGNIPRTAFEVGEDEELCDDYSGRLRGSKLRRTISEPALQHEWSVHRTVWHMDVHAYPLWDPDYSWACRVMDGWNR